MMSPKSRTDDKSKMPKAKSGQTDSLAGKLPEREILYHLLLEHSLDAILLTSPDGSILFANPAACLMFGRTEAELKELGRAGIVDVADPRLKAALDQRAHTGSFRGELTLVRRDGSKFPAEVSTNTFGFANDMTGTSMIIRDITERKQAEERQNALMAELDHRVKNVLARVAVTAASTRQASNSVDQFVRTLDGRIQSMAAAHTLLSQSGWQGVGLADLVSNQLAPYATDRNLAVSGSDVMLASPATQAVAMVLHELVTNAAKYGALSTPGGHVSVSWERMPNDDMTDSLMFTWREHGGPPVPPGLQSGYGISLIRNLVPHELGGKVDLVLESDGVSCRIEIPLEDERTAIADSH